MVTNKFSIRDAFAIRAGAGSGKTYTLSRRYVNAVLGFDFFSESSEEPPFWEEREARRAGVDEIVTITYTEAAALEMKERIFALMAKVAAYPALERNDGDYDSIAVAMARLPEGLREEVKARLDEMTTRMDEALITTIHGFGLALLRRYGDFVGADGALTVVTESEREAKFEAALFDVLNDPANREEVLAVGREVPLYKSRDIVRRYVFDRRFRESVESFGSEAETMKALLAAIHLPDIGDTVEEAVRELAATGHDGEALRRWVAAFERFEARPFGELAEALGISFDYRRKAIKENYATVKEVRDAYSGLVELFRVEAEKEARFEGLVARLKGLLRQIRAGYVKRLEADGQIDFDGIIEQAEAILRRVEPPFRYVMVDEFQDTNALQWSIAKLAARHANLFVVGDEKQSIYAFQGGEIEVFSRALAERFEGKVVPMEVNYRSDRTVLAFVNALFEKLFDGTTPLPVAADFCARHQALVAHSTEEGSATLLLTEKPDKTEEIDAAAKEAESIARYIAAIRAGRRHPHIGELMEKGDKAIAVVYDARSKMVHLKEALEAYGIPCKVSAAGNFWSKPEIRDIYFVLHGALLLQKKELDDFDRFVLAGAMKSEMVHLTDAELKKALRNGDFGALRDVAAKLPLSLHEAVHHLFYGTGAYLAYAVGGEGYEQATANVAQLVEEAAAFEAEYGYDLPRFVETMRQAIFFEEAETEEARYHAPGRESVELCSIHATKGLAYPMVILADGAKRLSRQSDTEGIKAGTFRDESGREHTLLGFKLGDYAPLAYRVLREVNRAKHMEEKKRLLYVALTRAEHDVVVSTLVPPEDDSYARMVEEALGVELATLEEGFDCGEGCRVAVVRGETLEEPERVEEGPQAWRIVPALAPLSFDEEPRSPERATDTGTHDVHKAAIGSAVHRIIELYHDDPAEEKVAKVLEEMGLYDESDAAQVFAKIEAFRRHPLFETLRKSREKYFELPVEGSGLHGVVDLLYFDEARGSWVVVDFKTGTPVDHAAQLEAYERILKAKGFEPLQTEVVYL